MVTRDEVRKIVTLLMKRPITEDIAIEVKSYEGYEHLEITDGEWVLNDVEDEMTTGEEHGWIETLILNAITNYVLKTRAGRVYPGDVTFVLDGEPGHLRVTREPDVSFVAKENVTPTRKFVFRAPDLAIEIVSPSQDLDEMRARLHQYLDYGTRQAWLVIPEIRQIEVYALDGFVAIYSVGQTVPGGDLLPGFTLDLAFVFEQ